MTSEDHHHTLRDILAKVASSDSEFAIPAVALLTGGKGPSVSPMEKILIGGSVAAWLIGKQPHCYLVIPGKFCTCHNFVTGVLNRKQITCKHELAVMMNRDEGKKAREMSWEEYEKLLSMLRVTHTG